MEKKLIALACTAIFISASIFWLIVSTLPINATIPQIVSNPKAWVNRKVRVEGELIGNFISFPRTLAFPYNYVLRDRDNRTMSIGVLYSEVILDTPTNVTVVGVVKIGATGGRTIYGEPISGSWVYFIEAEKMVVWN